MPRYIWGMIFPKTGAHFSGSCLSYFSVMLRVPEAACKGLTRSRPGLILNEGGGLAKLSGDDRRMASSALARIGYFRASFGRHAAPPIPDPLPALRHRQRFAGAGAGQGHGRCKAVAAAEKSQRSQ